MGLLDAIGVIKNEGKRFINDAMPGGLLNPELTPENIRASAEVGSMEPGIIGSGLSGFLAIDDMRNGNYGDAALNGIGVLPILPSMVVFKEAKPHITDLLIAAKQKMPGEKKEIGEFSMNQLADLIANGLTPKRMTASDLSHVEEKFGPNFPLWNKSQIFGLLERAGADTAEVNYRGGNRFGLLGSAEKDAKGSSYRPEAVFQMQGTDADLYSIGRKYDNARDWWVQEKRGKTSRR